MASSSKHFSLAFLKTKLLLALLAIFISLPVMAADWLYTVRGKDTAASLGKKYLINPYRIDAILKYNQVQAENLKPGMVLKFPLSSLKFGPARVQVVVFEGDVSFRRNNLVSPLDTVISLQLNDAILTGAKSSVTLKFADNSELLLGSNSELIFDVLTSWGRTGMVDTKMRLMKGSIEGRVNELKGPGAHFEVHTPTAVATVRGTEFRVRVNAENISVSYNEVSEGKVLVENNVSDKMVPTGFGLVSQAGKAADKPIELLAPPQLINPLSQYPALPVSLDWEGDSAAEKGYRLEIFKGADFSNQIRSLVVAQSDVALNQLPAGEYTVRLRAIDSNGLEGMNRVHRFALSGAPQAPINLQVKSDLEYSETPSFNWSSSQAAQSYELQIAEDAQFKSLIAQEVTQNTSFSYTKYLSPGTYFWRVVASNKLGRGYFSDTQSFVVALPKSIAVNAINDIEVGNSPSVSWSAVPNVDQYYWQLSEDDNFEKIIDQGSTTSTQLKLDNLEENNYYFRVKAGGNNDNGSHQYSEGQAFSVNQPGNGKEPFMLGSLLLVLLLL